MTTAEPTSRGYRTYAAALLVLVYFFYMVDRQAIVISQELIKKEFALSDTRIGLVTGTIYGIAYALAGLPLGWATDRVNRKKLLATLVGTWSALTALCGVSTSYIHLALARLGIGIAESGGAPASLSILSEMYPPEKRATVSSIFFAGSGIGAIVSFLVGGYVAGHYGWRAVFILYGLPGILIAALIFLTIREPARSALRNKEVVRGNLVHELTKVLRAPGLAPLYLGTAFSTMAVTGVGTWLVPFFMRAYKLDLGTTGAIVGLASGVFCTVGMIGTSMISDRARRRSPRGPLTVVMIGVLAYVALGLLTLASSNLTVSVVALCAMALVMLVNVGPANAMIAELAPAEARGLAFALFTFISNVIGAGLGPLLIGVLSDRLGGDSAALRHAMMIVLLSQLVSIFAYRVAARQVGRVMANPVA